MKTPQPLLPAILHTPKSDDKRNVQLARGTFIIKDFSKNPHFNEILKTLENKLDDDNNNKANTEALDDLTRQLMEALDTNEVVGWKESIDQVPTSTATSNGGGAPFGKCQFYKWVELLCESEFNLQVTNFKWRAGIGLYVTQRHCVFKPITNQVRVVALSLPQLTQALFLQKNQMLQIVF